METYCLWVPHQGQLEFDFLQNAEHNKCNGSYETDLWHSQPRGDGF